MGDSVKSKSKIKSIILIKIKTVLYIWLVLTSKLLMDMYYTLSSVAEKKKTWK